MALILRVLALLMLAALPAAAQEPLRIEITEGTAATPLAIALPTFSGPEARAEQIRALIAADLSTSGLFREIPPQAHISRPASIDTPPVWEDWRALHGDALVLGAVEEAPEGRIAVSFRLFDVAAGAALGEGLRFDAAAADWRRLAHKVADQIMSRMTGETAAFDSRIAFTGATAAGKRLGMVDADGAGLVWLTPAEGLALSPRLTDEAVFFTGLRGGQPQVQRLDLATLRSAPLPMPAGVMGFGAVPSPDGRWLALTQSVAGNTDIWLRDTASGAGRALTTGPEIDTSPSFSPDGGRIVYESDRSGSPQLYVQALAGGVPQRLSLGAGRNGGPAWSPTGELIAFVHAEGRGGGAPTRIGVVRPDGSGLRLLTDGALDAGPSWSPNGRWIVFARRGIDGSRPRLAVIDAYGQGEILREIAPEGIAASDPDWGGVLP